MPFLGKSTKDAITKILSVTWPLTAIKIWNALVKENYNLTYKATYKAIQELTQENILEKDNNEYKLNEQWLKTTANTALETIRAYQNKQGKANQTTANVTIFKFSEEFYRILTTMLLSKGEIRLASKTPALFIKKESTGSYLRQEYAKTLWNKIKEGKEIYYLFSTELSLKLIQETKDTGAIDKLKQLEQYQNLHIKHAPIHAIVTLAITKNTAIIGLASPNHTDLIGFIKIDGPNLSEIEQLYDSIFGNANSIKEYITTIEKLTCT